MSPWGRWILEHINLSELGYYGYLQRTYVLDSAAEMWPGVDLSVWWARVLRGVA